jgi:hypothetical protein
MKTIKSILIAATLVSTALVSGLSAQEAEKPTFNVELGDSVMIKRECERYLTGEKMSTWVYDRIHVVGQLGTKRFPEGVMLDNGNGGIISWVCQECIGPVTPKEPKAEPAPEPEPEPAPAPAPEPEPEPAPAPAPEPEPEPIPEVNEDTIGQSGNIAVAEEEPEPEPEPAKVKSGYDRFTIGLRGGASSLLHKAEVGNWTCGFDAILDLQYAHYWTKEGRPVDLGIIAGLGIGYQQSGLKTAINDQYTRSTEAGDIEYTIKADEVKETDRNIQLEVPVMFSLIHESGLFFNVGPKFMIPVFTPYNQAISNNENTVVNALFKDRNVLVQNDAVTGVLGDDQYKLKGTDNGIQFNCNVMVTAEIGYEWILKNGHSLGLGAFANYSVFNTFKNGSTVSDPIVDLSTAPSTASVAKFDVNAATKSYAKSVGFFDAGIKLAYHFNFPKKQPKVKAEEAAEIAPAPEAAAEE